MGHKTKIGKQRKDKYYRLAKETGFRSRAAFKLLQLNRKYGFLEKSKVLIDLCAAPGGWMQVAQQNMPVSSIVIGVDLFPIKSIPGCISLVEDITTDKCRIALKKALQSWKADVVLNDGAPNVGTNWDFDAYQQVCLTLSALKLATQFLRKGGWFITKIFRSKDYDSLMWVFQQLFKRVEATKPQASRSESAEIFVVCKNYLAPDEIDPKFMQAQYVFKELDLTTANKSNIFRPDKQKKPKPVGYAEGDYTLFHSFKVSEFLNSVEPVVFLQNVSELVFDDESVRDHELTTKEIKECCKDIRVLNRKDLKALLKWKKAMVDFLNEKNKENEVVEKIPEVKKDEVDEDEEELNEIEKHIQELKEEEMRSLKKKRRAAEKEKKKLKEKMELKMVLEGDSGPVLEEENIFKLSQIKTNKDLANVTEQGPETLAESDQESEEDVLPKRKRVKYDAEKTRLDSSGTFYKEEDSEPEEESESERSVDLEEGLGLSDDENDAGDDIDYGDDDDEENKNPLITDLDHRRRREKRLSKVNLWFDKDVFRDLETEADEDYELDNLVNDLKKKGNTIVGEEEKEGNDAEEDVNESSDSDSETSSDGSDYNVEKQMGKKMKRKMKDKQFDVVAKNSGKIRLPVPKRDVLNAVERMLLNRDDSGLSWKESLRTYRQTSRLSHLQRRSRQHPKKKKKLNSEGLALGTLMISSQKKKRDLVDAAWNRYAFNDENLPDWFAEDEKKHMTQEIPVPEELVTEYNKKLTEINARPIKKVIEAKARKKKRMLRRLKKAKKKVEEIMENPDATGRERVRQIQKLYNNVRGKKKEVTYVVSRKHLATKRVRRPPGIKGRFKVVDPRMKKDKRRAKSQGKKGKSGGRRTSRKK